FKVAVDQAGNLFIADSNRVRRLDSAGVLSTVAGDGTFDSGGDGGPATLAQFAGITGLTVDPTGNLFVIDQSGNRIRMVDTGGTVTPTAGNGKGGFLGDNGPAILAELAQPGGVAVDGAGTLFKSDPFNNRVRRVPAKVPDALPSITSLSPFY